MIKRLLLVDDDKIFCQVLSRAIIKKGFDVNIAHNVNQAVELAKACMPDYAIVDLNMPGPSGLILIKELLSINVSCKIVILTGFASIVTAIESIKLGATHYLVKPTDLNEILAAFSKDCGDILAEVKPIPMSPDRLEWEHIQKSLSDMNGNISKTAKLLNMHRRTLQRKLAKRPVNQ